jgi:guanylate kinase
MGADQMTDQRHVSETPPEAALAIAAPAVWPYDELLEWPRGLLVVLSGPSGAGKDAIITALQASGFPLTKVVTATTRAIRPNEVPGKDYHFLSADEFARWRQTGKLLEWAEVYGTPYGTPVEDVRRALVADETVLLKIDVQGAAQIKQKAPNAVFIFVGPGSFEELLQRLRRRGTETEEQYQRRVQQAREELAQLPFYDYLVINRQGDLARAVQQVEAIITAERLRVHRQPIVLP